MMSRLHLIIYIILLAFPLAVQAQDDSGRSIYDEAEREYKIGRVEQARDLLLNNIGTFKNSLRESAYKLLTICYLGLDDTAQAESCATKLLRRDPYFTPSPQDPQRFIDLIEDIKSGLTTTIITASSQAETLSEVPVPTTLITEEMIHNSGATNLQEVLAAYVPGMNIIDCNDDINIAMRGIYSNGQEKILIMLNGHRLNSYCTNTAAPDFSISLEKIKQIEVLRGPASSLYGGVALTAVVNLITKQGVDLDGVKAKVSAGNHGQLRGDLLFGKRYFDLDLLIWGGIYKADGEHIDVPEERWYEDLLGMPEKRTTIGYIGNKPSYDFGIQLKWKDLQFLYDTHFSQVIPPYTMSTLAKGYAHDDYRTFNGFSPSFATQSHHANLNYSRQIGPLTLKGTLTYDNSDLTHYQVIFDYPLPMLGNLLGFDYGDPVNVFGKPGLFRYINGQEQNYGGQLKGDLSYINTEHHKGSIAFGAEFSHFQLDDVRYALGYNFNEIIPENQTISNFGKGSENSYNAFVQLKHRWRSLIFNTGLRYDHKMRTDDYRVSELSPRLALILLQPKWNVKLSYSKSFVDAPYLYRKTNQLLSLLVGDYTGGENSLLLPETVNSLQLTFAGLEWVKGLKFEVNGFYNRAKNLIMTHVIEQANEGNNKVLGVELAATYRLPRFTADFNVTWSHTYEANLFTQDVDANNNLPALMSNLLLSWQATPRLKFYSHLAFEGHQTSYNLDVVELMSYYNAWNAYNYHLGRDEIDEAIKWLELMEDISDNLIMQEDISARLIANVGAEYRLGRVTLGVNVRNLFDTDYYRSGMNTRLIPQRGRWWTASVAYKF